ncbi:hypothetical protein RvY_13568 [Ramazzottius varieornatus]|uniref:Uncharacterized protein n=1 Tax=Ramazzottius varieornatus TaxID=947166 RepID=A0A1D1VTK0_RAMVA|nr:hypothetical protein RvY_13568 [Ramazzottius varieornatus]
MNVPTPDKVSEEIQLDGTELLPKPKRLLNRLLHGALTVLVTADSSKRKPLSKAEPYEASDSDENELLASLKFSLD